MQSYAAKSLVSCALGLVVLAGCAAVPETSASKHVQSGIVASIEPATAVVMPTNYLSSGSDNAAADKADKTEGRRQDVITVDFADGTESRYFSDTAPDYNVGDVVEVLTTGNDSLFVRR